MRYAMLWLGLVGCDDVLFGQADEGEDEGPSQDGYAGVVEIVTVNCYGCHSAAANTSAGFNLDLETDLHASTVGVAGGYGVPLVVPGSTGGTMPPGGGLSDANTDVVRAWIEDGAPQ
jgi:mono/diheme cytochrome c family protein